jgi:hypothetical protein
MIDVTKVPERKRRHKKTSGTGSSSRATHARSTSAGARPGDPWPFKAEHTSPLTWWRRLPSDAFRDAERLLLLATLEGITVLHGGDNFTAALRGDAAATIGAAFSVMPVEEMTLQVDIAMTALLRCALERNAAAALVLAQVLGLTDLGHSLGTELAASWFTHGLRHSADPPKLTQAKTTLLAAFRERDRNGENA